MALSFIKKKTTTEPTSEPETTTASQTETSKPSPAPNTTAKIINMKPNAASWMRTGKDAKQALNQEEAKAEERKAEAGKMWRFFVTPGKDAQITFLDGKLDEDGMLDIPVWYEHNIRLNGERETYACTAGKDQSQPCPLCEMGDKPAFVGVMTIIDHTAHVIQNGPNKGKTIQNTRKLFVAKRLTIKLLTKNSVKRGGLAGCTFDVSRPDEKNAAVGESFDFVQKFDKLSEIAAKWNLTLEDVQPAIYDEEFTFRTPEQLIALGVHKAQLNTKGYKSGKTSNLKDDL